DHRERGLCRLGRGQDVHAGHCPRGPGAPGAHRCRLARGGSERAGVSPACNIKPQPVLRRQNGLRVYAANRMQGGEGSAALTVCIDTVNMETINRGAVWYVEEMTWRQ